MKDGIGSLAAGHLEFKLPKEDNDPPLRYEIFFGSEIIFKPLKSQTEPWNFLFLTNPVHRERLVNAVTSVMPLLFLTEIPRFPFTWVIEPSEIPGLDF